MIVVLTAMSWLFALGSVWCTKTFIGKIQWYAWVAVVVSAANTVVQLGALL